MIIFKRVEERLIPPKESLKIKFAVSAKIPVIYARPPLINIIAKISLKFH
jgi:hypothetical protein